MKRIERIVDATHDGKRLDRFLRDALPGFPPRAFRLALESGEVFVDGARGSKGDSVREGQVVVARALAETADWNPLPGDVEGASVIFQDGIVAALEKPRGIPTDPQRVREAGTLAGYFLWRFPETSSWCMAPEIPLLSRLDIDTSGIVLAALTGSAYRSLLRQRQASSIGKRYLCLVAGRIDESMVLPATIDSRGGARVTVRPETPDPDPVYWTRIIPLAGDGRFTLVSAEIRKGKRHQIRAHLAAAGYPIVGDRVYGRGSGTGRLMLHALEVSFDHPETGERMTLASPAPEEFAI